LDFQTCLETNDRQRSNIPKKQVVVAKLLSIFIIAKTFKKVRTMIKTRTLAKNGDRIYFRF